jgi:hypothetical protein
MPSLELRAPFQDAAHPPARGRQHGVGSMYGAYRGAYALRPCPCPRGRLGGARRRVRCWLLARRRSPQPPLLWRVQQEPERHSEPGRLSHAACRPGQLWSTLQERWSLQAIQTMAACLAACEAGPPAICWACRQPQPGMRAAPDPSSERAASNTILPRAAQTMRLVRVACAKAAEVADGLRAALKGHEAARVARRVRRHGGAAAGAAAGGGAAAARPDAGALGARPAPSAPPGN